MTHKISDVSVIIPVYNEENRLIECLKSITSQALKPKEIIVVDNNSTDQSVAIARSFKGVKIIKEPRQGMICARDAGFNKAKGSILARIDADTVVSADWVQQIQIFFDANSIVSGVTGYGQSRVGFTSNTLSMICSYFYHANCQSYFGAKMLWGANMAITKESWLAIKDLVYTGRYVNDIHEDQDLSLALISTGRKIEILKYLVVGCDFSEAQYFKKFWRYVKMRTTNKKIHYAHKRSKLKTHKLMPMYQRIYLGFVSYPFMALYTGFTALNSVAKTLADYSGLHPLV